MGHLVTFEYSGALDMLEQSKVTLTSPVAVWEGGQLRYKRKLSKLKWNQALEYTYLQYAQGMVDYPTMKLVSPGFTGMVDVYQDLETGGYNYSFGMREVEQRVRRRRQRYYAEMYLVDVDVNTKIRSCLDGQVYTLEELYFRGIFEVYLITWEFQGSLLLAEEVPNGIQIITGTNDLVKGEDDVGLHYLFAKIKVLDNGSNQEKLIILDETLARGVSNLYYRIQIKGLQLRLLLNQRNFDDVQFLVDGFSELENPDEKINTVLLEGRKLRQNNSVFILRESFDHTNLSIKYNYGISQMLSGKIIDAQKTLEAIILESENNTAVLEEDIIEYNQTYAYILTELHEYEIAERLYESILDRARKVNHKNLFYIMTTLVYIKRTQKKLVEATQIVDEALQLVNGDLTRLTVHSIQKGFIEYYSNDKEYISSFRNVITWGTEAFNSGKLSPLDLINYLCIITVMNYVIDDRSEFNFGANRLMSIIEKNHEIFQNSFALDIEKLVSVMQHSIKFNLSIQHINSLFEIMSDGSKEKSIRLYSFVVWAITRSYHLEFRDEIKQQAISLALDDLKYYNKSDIFQFLDRNQIFNESNFKDWESSLDQIISGDMVTFAKEVLFLVVK